MKHELEAEKLVVILSMFIFQKSPHDQKNTPQKEVRAYRDATGMNGLIGGK